VAADLVGTVHVGGFSLAPAQIILIGSGLVVIGGSLLVRSPAQAAPAADTGIERLRPSQHGR
jgi:hypothetical protein